MNQQKWDLQEPTNFFNTFGVKRVNINFPEVREPLLELPYPSDLYCSSELERELEDGSNHHNLDNVHESVVELSIAMTEV